MNIVISLGVLVVLAICNNVGVCNCEAEKAISNCEI